MKKTNFLLMACAGIFLFVCAMDMSVYAQAKAQGVQKEGPKKPAIIKKEAKSIQGEVTWIGKNKIAVVYSRGEGSEEEMLLPFDGNVTLERVSDLSQIQQGDTVYIQYEETTQETKEGASQSVAKANAISFVRPGTRKPVQAQSSGSDSEGEGEDLETYTSE
ncbi:MAG: hypothetical protein PHV55_05480 [Candidatus Omnitrophica bacterium]|nr:hypothetical protein [Candidatus Omnitrophota bacterium]